MTLTYVRIYIKGQEGVKGTRDSIGLVLLKVELTQESLCRGQIRSCHLKADQVTSSFKCHFKVSCVSCAGALGTEVLPFDNFPG